MTRFLVSISLLAIGLSCSEADSEPPFMEEQAEEMCTPSTVDGRSACEDGLCEANQFCGGFECVTGCQSNSNCAAGDFCDKSAATGARRAGICRPCGGEGRPAQSACMDVQGNYNLLPFENNPDQCSLFQVDVCSVTQTDTLLGISCFAGEDATPSTCTLDQDNCTCNLSIQVERIPTTVEVDFENDQVTASGGGVVCQFELD